MAHLAALATENKLMAVVRATRLDAFKALQNKSGQVVLFDHYSKHITSGGYIRYFHALLIQIVLSFGGFYFNLLQDGSKILFFSSVQFKFHIFV